MPALQCNLCGNTGMCGAEWVSLTQTQTIRSHAYSFRMHDHFSAIVGCMSTTTTTAANGKCTWSNARYSSECYVGAGEVYMRNSPGKGLSLEQCKKSCVDAAGCQSITYFDSGWCSHFSTPCTKVKWHKKGVAFTLSCKATFLPCGTANT